MGNPIHERTRIVKIFILEDDPSRIKQFRKYLPRQYGHDAEIVITQTAADAKATLAARAPFDIAFLDHDLGEEVYVSSLNEETGYRVAEFIARKKIPISRIALHSLNTPGAIKMEMVLKKAGYDAARFPFIQWLQQAKDA